MQRRFGMPSQYLITAGELDRAITDQAVRVVDCRYTLSDPSAGRLAYLKAHIPGAIYAHLDDDLAGPVGPRTGRHPLPDPKVFAALLGAWGIRRDTRVVAYDEASGALASRFWWMLGWLGHSHRQLLDGGFSAWVEEGLPLETETKSWPPANYEPEVRSDKVVTTTDVEHSLGSGPRLVDARDEERFAGRSEPIDPVAGHIPGALNHPFARNLDSHNRFLSGGELRRRYRRLLEPISDRPVMMCGSGVTACHNAFAMAVAGLEEPQLYVGSWSEWITDPDRPVARDRQDDGAQG